jgi:16S rRNA (cytosine967-C5)-methyltransferase
MPTAEVCAVAARIVHDVVTQGRSLEMAAKKHLNSVPARRSSETREIAWGALRWWHRYQGVLSRQLHRPLRARDRILESLLVCGLYQYDHLDEPDYAVTASTVDAAALLGAPKATSLINAVLRSHLRAKTSAGPASDEELFATPRWLLNAIRKAWPNQWNQVLETANRKPPMTLRVNSLQMPRDEYLEWLRQQGFSAQASTLSPWGVILDKPVSVAELPGFAAGKVSIQDAAAQMTPIFCQPAQGARVLDACAAPGGKCTHLLEVYPQIKSLTALDRPGRTEAISDNLTRLGLTAKLIADDVLQPETWWDGQLFDLIVLDAPCSGTGVMRRHPDIRHHRRASDIIAYARTQAQMAARLWPLLAPGGQLLYITCSVLPEENDGPLLELHRRHSGIKQDKPTVSGALTTELGNQFLPNEEHDGLYFASLFKD